MANEKVIHLSEQDFDSGVAEGLTLVDFWAEWCAPCLALGPHIDKIAEDYAGKVRVAKVDIDANPNIPGKLGIRGIPTVMLFKDGQQVNVTIGNDPRKVRAMVDQAL
ncbi:MAG: thioredoxin [Candidatus Lambdaproteobacteria bacterium]|nr:thioredoxin [Candidatus Lambdaproteobacteria bacterium]